MTNIVDILLSNDLIPIDSILTVTVNNFNAFGSNMQQTRKMVLENIEPQSSNGYKLTLRDFKYTMDVSTNFTLFEVLAIDGMPTSKFAEVYNLNDDGTTRVAGKKRGRKCKVRSLP